MVPTQSLGDAEPYEIGQREIARIARVAERESGIVVDPSRPDFLVSRLGARLHALNFKGFQEYCDLLEAPSSEELRPFVEALTTHTTSFFRESPQYKWLSDIGLASLICSGAGIQRDLVVWSAACSTGQELFTAMMVLDDYRLSTEKALRFRGVGTDLSARIVRQAERAVYSAEDIDTIPLELRRRYLLSSRSNETVVRIVPELRRRCAWRTANLLRSHSFNQIDADIVFIRNVLIYFDRETQAEVLSNVLARLRPGGVLLTGHAETSEARRLGLETLRPSIYRKD